MDFGFLIPLWVCIIYATYTAVTTETLRVQNSK